MRVDWQVFAQFVHIVWTSNCSHSSIFHDRSPALGVAGVLASIPTVFGWRQGTSWTSQHFIAGPHGDKQPFTLAVTHRPELQICLTCTSLTCVLWDSLKENSQQRRENMQTPHRKRLRDRGLNPQPSCWKATLIAAPLWRPTAAMLILNWPLNKPVNII